MSDLDILFKITTAQLGVRTAAHDLKAAHEKIREADGTRERAVEAAQRAKVSFALYERDLADYMAAFKEKHAL